MISFDYASFEDYWSSFSMPIGQIGQRVAALPTELRAEVERHVRSGVAARYWVAKRHAKRTVWICGVRPIDNFPHCSARRAQTAPNGCGFGTGVRTRASR